MTEQQRLSLQVPRDQSKEKIVSTGSATGNPRNKCALKPGHSLMDWVRLGSSGCDLTGTKGVIRPVTSSELELHCKKDDAWLSIRGKVYNVTHYMDFHPGGPDELMKGVGKDATKIFDEIHAWVNYEQLLSKCYIGPLQNIVTVDLEPARSSFRKHQKTSSANGGNIKTTNSSTLLSPTISTSTTNAVVPLPPLFNISGAIGISSSAKTSPIKKYDTNNIYSSNSQSSEDLINPRFDWIQKTTEIVLIFYTKSFCNPGIIISYKSDCDYLIKIVIERMTYAYNLKLLHDVKWPGIVKLNSETGKMEIYFKKSKPELWINYGTMDFKKLYNADDLHLNYEFVNGEQITHDSYAICLRSCDKTIMITPIGYHVSVTAIIDGIDVTRSYTPVPGNYLPSSTSTNCNNYRSNICIGFLIKSYATGILAKYLTTTSLSVNSSSTSIANTDKSTSSLKIIQTPIPISLSSLNNSNSCSSISCNINDNSKSNNDNSDTRISTNHTVVILSQPKGNFVLKKLINHYRIGLLAAGSGITPMLSVLDHLLMRNTNRIENIQFLLFNKTEKDIWCRQKLESIAAKDERLIIRHILSEPDTNWNGEKGRITKPLITSLCDKNSESYVTYCCICGPTQFNDLSLKLLKDIGFEVINLHFFQG